MRHVLDKAMRAAENDSILKKRFGSYGQGIPPLDWTIKTVLKIVYPYIIEAVVEALRSETEVRADEDGCMVKMPVYGFPKAADFIEREFIERENT